MAIEFRESTEAEKAIIKESLSYWLDKKKLELIEKKSHILIGIGNWKEVFKWQSSRSKIPDRRKIFRLFRRRRNRSRYPRTSY